MPLRGQQPDGVRLSETHRRSHFESQGGGGKWLVFPGSFLFRPEEFAGCAQLRDAFQALGRGSHHTGRHRGRPSAGSRSSRGEPAVGPVPCRLRFARFQGFAGVSRWCRLVSALRGVFTTFLSSPFVVARGRGLPGATEAAPPPPGYSLQSPVNFLPKPPSPSSV